VDNSKVLPFVDRDRLNQQLDEEIVDRERAVELEALADERLQELEWSGPRSHGSRRALGAH